MPDLPRVKRFKSLKNLAVFRSYSASPETGDFARYNLLYGYNGSGKTTLSRVLASLEAGAFHQKLPPEGKFEIELTDNSVIKTNDRLDALKGRILIFNEDFVSENFRWKNDSANPIFYLGKEQAELADKLKKQEIELAKLSAEVPSASAALKEKEKAFNDYKRETAKSIWEQINAGSRRYEAPQLAADFADNQSYDADCELDDATRQQCTAIVNQAAPLSKLSELAGVKLSLAKVLHDVRGLLGTSLGSAAIQDLRQHETMLKWVKEGSDYHRLHNLKTCLHCGNALTEERLNALQSLIDDKFDELVNNIKHAQIKVSDISSDLKRLETSLPSKNDVSPDQADKYQAASQKLKSAIVAAQEIVGQLVSLLEQKARTPNIAVEASALPDEAATTQHDTGIVDQLEAINACIRGHNETHDQFQTKQDAARTQLKRHMLHQKQPRFRELETAHASAKLAKENMDNAHAALKTEVDGLRNKLRQDGPAAERVSHLVCNYLGHKEIKIETKDGGYHILRSGQKANDTLSEGEKTAISLCYFLSAIEAEGRNLKDLILVIDDPISSLDSKSLNYAFSLIKGALSETHQLFVLTHNLHFMNEVKKWLKKKIENAERDGKAPQAALYFLDLSYDAGTSTRSSGIAKMPKLIRDYESEYHYLFYVAQQFANDPAPQPDRLYLMPNALRKVLEIFLAFKVPGPDGLASKIESRPVRDCGIDHDRIRALDRLVQLESHADNLDDLVSLSPLTLEETKDAASSMLKLMEAMDKPHLEKLASLCR